MPNDAPFQTRVLVAALKLLEAQKGPVIEDFPEDAPVSEDVSTPWVCPVSFDTQEADLSDSDQLRGAFKREMIQLRSWYDLAVKRRGRTTVGVSGIDLDCLGDFVSAFLDGGIPENPREDIPLPLTLKLAVEDLKAYYSEAVTAQPGQPEPGGETIADWFWSQTTAAKVVFAVKESCTDSDDKMTQVVGKLLLVPAAQAHRSA